MDVLPRILYWDSLHILLENLIEKIKKVIITKEFTAILTEHMKSYIFSNFTYLPSER